MVRAIDHTDVAADGEPYTMEAEFDGACPDQCGYAIEPRDLITPVDDGYGGTMWVLAEHPAAD